MVVDRADRIGSLFYWLGRHHRQQVQLATKLVAENATFVDVGANIGEFSISVALQHRDAAVVAFEPNSKVRHLLCRNRDLNDLSNLHVFPDAVGDVNGSRMLYQSDDTMLSSLTAFSDRHQPTETVSVVTLDTLVAEQKLKSIDVLKIDVEGNEFNVLRGAVNAIRRFQPHIIVEVNSITSVAAGFGSADLLACMQELRYRFRVWKSDAWELAGAQDIPDSCDVWAEPLESSAAP
ncbi:MAG: FkbM family methyltransferase [Planctomycetota bacterium]